MRYLLDTNACVDYFSGRYPTVVDRFRRASPASLRVSSVVVAELRYGADKSANPGRNHSRLDVFLREVPCEDFGSDAAAMFGRLRTLLERRGTPIGPYDMMIAAHALSLELTLVTDNIREFSRVEALRIENWREP